MPETGLVDVLTTKIVAWEAERGKEFTYDGVSFLIPVLFYWMFNSFQNQVQSGSSSLGSSGMLYEGSSGDNAPFDINDFPQLTGRPNSAGGGQGQYGNTAMLPNLPMISRLYITSDYSYLKDH